MPERFRKEILEKYIAQKKTSIEIAEKFHCSEDQLKANIEKYCADKAKDFLRQIERNNATKAKDEERASKRSRNSLTTAKSSEEDSYEVTSPEAIKDEVLKENEASKEDFSELTIESFEEISSKVEDQRYVVAKQEVVVKTTIQKYRENCCNLAEKVDAFKHCLKTLSCLKAEIIQLQEASEQLILEHDSELNKLHSEQKKLTSLEEKLAEASKVEVCVYLDGSFSVDFDTVFEENATEIKSLRAELLMNDVVEELRIKDILQLAKILVLEKQEGVRYEFIFESLELEKIYIEHFKI